MNRFQYVDYSYYRQLDSSTDKQLGSEMSPFLSNYANVRRLIKIVYSIVGLFVYIHR